MMCASISRTEAQSEVQSPIVTYDDVRPVFKKHCVSCHSQQRARGDLNLSSTAGIKAGSTSGVVAVAGKPDESMLFTLPAHLEDPKMPPGAPKIPQRELDLIRKWIEDGMLEKAGIPVATVDTKNPARIPSSTKSDPALLIEAVRSLTRRTAITALAVSPRDSQVAVSGQKQVVLFSSSARTPERAFPFPEGEIHSLQFSRDGDWLLAGGGLSGESGRVVAYEVTTGKRVFEVGDEPDNVLAFDLSPDRALVALGGPGKNVKVYRVANGELVTTLAKHTDWILSVAFSPDGLLLASSDRFGGLQIWEASSGRAFQTLRGHVGPVNAIAWSADSERLLSGGQDGTLRLWELHQGTQLQQWDAQIGGVLAVSWPQADRILVGGRNRKVAVFDAAGKHQREWSLRDEVVELAMTTVGQHLISGDAGGNVTAWKIDSGTQESELVIPLLPATAPTDVSLPARKQRSRSDSSTPIAKLNDQPTGKMTDPRGLVDPELAATLEALRNTEAAVKSAEESLEKLRASAKTLKALAATRAAAVKQQVQQP